MALLIVAVMSITLFRPSVTGMLPANVQHEQLDIVIAQSQIYKMRFNETINVQSLGVSGSVSGNGTAYIFLDDRNGQRLLVYSNVRQPQNMGGARFITGMVTAAIEPSQVIGESIPLEPNEEIVSGTFVNECIQTCITPPDFTSDEYDLVFLVQPGVRLEVSEIIYIAE